MIRSKDSLSRLFSHCSLTTTKHPQPTRTLQSAGLPPPAAVPSFCVHWALCDELCSVLPVLALCLLGGGDGCVGCVACVACVWEEMDGSENAPSLSPFSSGISAAFLTSPL